jgi:hypothetical protein
MEGSYRRLGIFALVLGFGLAIQVATRGQDPAETSPLVKQNASAPPLAGEPAPAAAPDSGTKGVQVMARGPVHEAFATPAGEPVPTDPVAKQPPKPLDEMPPEDKPAGKDMVWIGGYWAWDDDRKDFLWVTGIWRAPPPGKHWVPGYWKEDADQWRWIPGFWKTESAEVASTNQSQDMTYLPEPPKPPQVAPPGDPPDKESFYIPGGWVWTSNGYVWRAGYWGRVQPGYVWVPGHYRWTLFGYVYVPGYWDLSVADRGVLYAPVVVDPYVVGPGYVYTPVYVVPPALVVDAFWVRPAYCHYYFGDYYGVTYSRCGFVSVAVYSEYHYDPIFVYARYEHRYEPGWASVQVNVYNDRFYGRAPAPPRTLVQNNTVINNNTTVINNNTVNNNTVNNNTVNNNTVNNKTVNNNSTTNLMTTKQFAASRGMQTTPLTPAARQQVQQQAQSIRQVAAQRAKAETPTGGKITQPRTASIGNVPHMSTPPKTPAASRSPAQGNQAAGRGPNQVGPNGSQPTAGTMNRSGPNNPNAKQTNTKRPPPRTPPPKRNEHNKG